MNVCHLGGGVYELPVDRAGRANALSRDMVAKLAAGIQQATDVGARILVLTAQGSVFCGGIDLVEARSLSDWQLRDHFRSINELFRRISTAPFLTIAAVGGRAVGAGADLALACDQRVGSCSAAFNFPGVQFGLLLATGRLASIVGSGPAQSILLQRRVVKYEEASGLGLLTKSVEERDVRYQAVKLAEEFDRVPVNVGDLCEITRNADDSGFSGFERSLSVGISERIQEFSQTVRAVGA